MSIARRTILSGLVLMIVVVGGTSSGALAYMVWTKSLKRASTPVVHHNDAVLIEIKVTIVPHPTRTPSPSPTLLPLQ